MNADLRNRVLVSLGFVVFALLLDYIPFPGLNISEITWTLDFNDRGSGWPGPRVGILTYVFASLLVTLFIYLRSNLGEVDDRRLPLEGYTLILTAAIALEHGYQRALFYGGIQSAHGNTVFIDPEWLFRLLAMVFSVALAFLFVWAARMITRHGIGNGVCVLVLADVIARLPNYVWGIIQEVLDKGRTAPGYAALYVVVTVVIFLVIVWLLRARWPVPVEANDDASRAPHRPLFLHVNSVGTVGYYVSLTAIGFLITRLLPGTVTDRIAKIMQSGEWIYWGVLGVLTLVATYWLANVAHDPRGLRRALKGCQTDAAIVVDEERYSRNLGVAAAVLTVLVLTICTALSWHAARHALTGLTALTLFPITAILLDVYRQYRIHARMAAPDTAGRESVCGDCGAKVHDEARYCDHCGAAFEEDQLACAEHTDRKAEAACIFCGKTLCEECAFGVDDRYTCEDHGIAELFYDWATVATVRTQIEAALCRRRLVGIPAEVLSNTVEPMYGTFGLFDVNPITPWVAYREISGGQIRILVPVHDWVRARLALGMPTEML